MTANPISARLRSCQELHNVTRNVLEQALVICHQQGYNQDWIDALEKALADNEIAWSHLHSIATLIELVAPPITH